MSGQRTQPLVLQSLGGDGGVALESRRGLPIIRCRPTHTPALLRVRVSLFMLKRLCGVEPHGYLRMIFTSELIQSVAVFPTILCLKPLTCRLR